MLLDSGPSGHLYTDRILATMKDAGVKQIDYFVVSHYHWDHFGTIAELAPRVPVLNFVDHGANVEADRSPEFYRFWGITLSIPITTAMSRPAKKVASRGPRQAIVFP